MAVKRNERTLPLTLKSAATYPLNAGLVSAYDWAAGDGAPHVGTWTLSKDAGADFPIVEVQPGMLGRDISQGMRTDVRQAYRKQFVRELGIGSADGKGPFTIHNRYRTPSAYTGTTGSRTLALYTDSGGTKARLLVVDDPGGFVYFAWELSGTYNSAYTLPSASARYSDPTFRVPHNTVVDLHLVRNGDDLHYYINGTLVASVNLPLYVMDNAAWTGVNTAGQHGFTGATPSNVILIDMNLWNRALSGTEVAQHSADAYAGYANTGTSTPPPPTNTKPAAPTAVVATAGVGSATVNGTPGSDGGAAVTQYNALVYRASDNVIVANVGSPTLPVTVTGLASDVQVYAKLTATNSVGTSDPSASSNLVTPTAPPVEEPPPTPPPAGTTPVRFDFPASYPIYAAEADTGVTGVAISPTSATVAGNGTHQFNAVVTGSAADKSVTWSVTGAGGEVNSFGNFTAPDATTSDQEFKVRATSNADTNKWSEATVMVLAVVVDEVSAVNIAPLTATVQGNSQLQMQAVVSGPNNPPQNVDWTATGGTISTSGLLTLPPATNFDQLIFVRATSALDPRKWAEAAITVAAAIVDAVESVTVDPQVITVEGGETIQFSATVNGPDDPDQAVTWSTTLGFIDGTGTIMAPPPQPREQVGTVTATSVQDPNKKGTAVLIVSAGMVASFIPSVSRQVRILPGRSAFAVGSHWTLGPAGPVGTKDPNSEIDIPFDWTEWLADIGNPALSKIEFLLGGGLVATGTVANPKGGTVVVSGGSLQQTGTVTCRITTDTSPPRVEDRTVVLQMKEQ